MSYAIKNWLAGTPGPFVARTPNEVWDAAWHNFNQGETGGIYVQLDFMLRLGQAGFGIRHLAVGGHALDRVT